MLDIKWIRENPEALDRALANRGGGAGRPTRLIALDEARRAHIRKLEEAQARRNAASKEIGKAKAQKDEATAARLMAEVAALKDDDADARGGGRRRPTRRWTMRSRSSRTCRSTTCRSARTSTPTSSIADWGKQARR